MRLIDADALIADLEHDVAIDQDTLDYEDLTEINRANIQFDKDCKKNAIDLLKNAPTIEPEQRWIPTKIAKPPKAGQYLVTKQQKTGVCQIATAHYNPSFDEWAGNGNFKKILAWQPLPSPYKQE